MINKLVNKVQVVIVLPLILESIVLCWHSLEEVSSVNIERCPHLEKWRLVSSLEVKRQEKCMKT